MAPNGEYIMIPYSRVISYGMTEVQNELIRRNLPSLEYELYATDIASDIVGISADAVIINSSVLSADDSKMVIEYYYESNAHLEQSVFWIGKNNLPNNLRCKIGHYECIEMMAVNLKYRLLEAHKRVAKSKDFSRRIADCIMILSAIRSHPGIQTKELAEKMELSIRTVQRYITTLQVAGEWIEYDTIKRGWRLQNGCSILFGDHLK